VNEKGELVCENIIEVSHTQVLVTDWMMGTDWQRPGKIVPFPKYSTVRSEFTHWSNQCG
jgi:hypothetical protein